MSGIGDFETDVDPAAEFLAREQDELAGLEDEVKLAPPSAPVAKNDGANSPNGFEMVDGYGDSYKEDDSSFLKPEHDPLRSVSPSPPPLNREVREEPERIRIWREEQIKRLEAKDAEEEERKAELREKAKKELEDWYTNHREAIAKTKAANRNAEKQFVAEDDEIEPGTEWERIAKLCDFNPKAKQGSKDVSRMRSIVLQMKQSPVAINNKA